MRNDQLFLTLLLALSCLACDSSGGDLTWPHRVLERSGDNPAWRQPDYDDRHWNANGESDRDTIFWLRMHFEFEKAPAANRHMGLFLFAFGAQELFWDGHHIGDNGKPGMQPEEERPGRLIACFLLPDSLAQPGKHVLALRCSQQFEKTVKPSVKVRANDYSHLLRFPLIITSFMHILAGAYLLAGIYYLFLFLSYRKESTVFIFSLCCFIFFGLILLEYLKYYVLYPYPWHYTRLDAIGGLTTTAALLVPLYFGLHFKVPKLKLVLGGYILVLVFFYFLLWGQYDNTARMMGRCMWGLSFGMVTYAAYRSTKGAPLVLGGLLLSSIIDHFLVYDISLYVSFTIIIFCMFYLLTMRGKEQQQAYESSLLLSARLKNELLQKHIQPHFIMNTLTSLIDWVEESPEEGVKFMEALAEEFDILSRVANHRLIPVAQEIQLCKNHLIVMGYRKEIAYQWEDDGIDTREMIPPALIHTAVENGITHSLPHSDGRIGFKLEFEKFPYGKCYTLYTFAQNRADDQPIEQGTGMQYMESRLRESYGEQWDLISQPIPAGWMTKFIIHTP